MSYEYNSGDKALHALPNPYKIENVFVLACALIFIAAGIVVMLHVRDYIQAHQDKAAIFAAVLATVTVAIGIRLAVMGLSSLRFFIGRDFPIGLAGELAPMETGVGTGSANLQQQLRHKAVSFQEPSGILAGLLYSVVHPLHTAPRNIQDEAVKQFTALLGMVGVLCSLALSFFLFSGSPHEGVVSWAYLPLTGLSVLTLLKNKEGSLDFGARPMMIRLGGMGVFAVIGPALIARYVPPYPIPAMWLPPTLLLIGSAVAVSLFLVSTFSQIDAVKDTSVTCDQSVIDFQCHPAQFWTEIGRNFQHGWTQDIPNRRYINQPPDAGDAARGLFSGNILEETHPVMTDTSRFRGLKDAWRTGYARYLLLLAGWCLLLSCLAAYLAPSYAAEFGDMERMEMTRSVLAIFALGTAIVLGFKTGHLLWSRMYFRSRIIWVEVEGTYQKSELDVGNQITGHTRSKSTLTRVEDATLRVWVTDIESVVFGKDSVRSIIAMAPNEEYARGVSRRLKEFALDQSTIAAPTSNRDISKIAALKNLERELQAGIATGQLVPEAGISNAITDTSEPGEEILKGSVKFFDSDKGFGFLRGEDGVERFFGASQLVGMAAAIEPGAKVVFVASSNPKGPAAIRVREAHYEREY